MAGERNERQISNGVDFAGLSQILSTLFGPGDSKQTTKSTTTNSGGDLSALRAIFAQQAAASTPEGSKELVNTLFRQGFEQQLPDIFAANNAAGIRSGSTAELLKNDLAARLSGEAAKRLSDNQAQASQTANAIAVNSPRTSSTTNKTETKQDGVLGGKGNMLLSGLALLLNSLFNKDDKKKSPFERDPAIYENDAYNDISLGNDNSYSSSEAASAGGMNPLIAFQALSNPDVSRMFGSIFSDNGASSILDYQDPQLAISTNLATATPTPDYRGALLNFYSEHYKNPEQSLQDWVDPYFDGDYKKAYEHAYANFPGFRRQEGGTPLTSGGSSGSGSNFTDALTQGLASGTFGPGNGPSSGSGGLQISSF